MQPTFDMTIARLREFVEQVKIGAIELGECGSQLQAYVDHIAEGMNITEEQAAILKEQVKQAIQVNLSDEWPLILSPTQLAARSFFLKSAELIPRVYMRFDEPAGYTWERTDITKPRRVHEPIEAKVVVPQLPSKNLI